MVQDGFFFRPKEYDGTSRGGKKDKLVQRRGPLDGTPFFRWFICIINLGRNRAKGQNITTISTLCTNVPASLSKIFTNFFLEGGLHSPFGIFYNISNKFEPVIFRPRFGNKIPFIQGGMNHKQWIINP